MDLGSIVEEFLKTLEHRKSFDDLLPFYHKDIEQVEFPNLLSSKKTIRSLKELKIATDRGAKLLQSEHYQIVNKYICDRAVIVEVIWLGQLSKSLGKLNVGEELKAYFAQVYEFENGKIIKQRNYDCFEAF